MSEIEIRDPIHGFITLSEIESKIINTPVFQRLRKIKQLALASLVYPGANHTRFEHSIGTFHVASLIAEKLLQGKEHEEIRRVIRLSALLHDIGHGPFSHVSESILEKYSNNSSHQEKIHESITMRIIEQNKDLHKFLSEEEIKKIKGLLSGNSVDFPLMKDIVSGPIDADKMDYLLRDSYFCGVKYGVFDLYRLLNTLTFFEEFADKQIAINYGGVNSLEQFVLAKYYMTKQVYLHKIRLITDAMIVRAIELGIEADEIDFLKELYNFKDKNDEKYLKIYLEYDDERISNDIIYNSKGFAKEIFDMLQERRLFKKIFSEKLETLEISEQKVKDKLINISASENDTLRKKIESEVSIFVNCKKEYVISNSYTIKSVREMSRNSEGSIIIIDNNGNKRKFEEESTVFRSIDESMKDTYFEVYAPLEYIEQNTKREKIKEAKKEISNILNNIKEV